MSQDHERATGLWHAEWETLSGIIQLTAGAVNKALELTNGLEVDAQKILTNLEMTKGLIYAENVSLALADKIGKADAHELVDQCCKEAQINKVHLKEIILSTSLIKEHLKHEEIEKLFDPINSLGHSLLFIQKVLDNDIVS